MSALYSEVPEEIINMVKEVMGQFHQELIPYRIAVVYRFPAGMSSNGHPIWGNASKVPERYKTHMPFDFLLEIAKEIWISLTPEQRIAHIDHLLQHCGVDEEHNLYIRSHDIEEFNTVLKRHGAYSNQNFEASLTFQAMPLFPLDFDEPEGEVITVSGSEIGIVFNKQN